MKKIAVILLFISFFLGGFFTSQNILEKRIQVITLEKEKYKSLSQKIQECPQKECKQDIKLTAEKEKALENVVESKIHFSAKKTQTSPILTTVVVTMLGGSAMKVDASDLVFSYTDNLKILKITPGTAFPSYPRIVAENSMLTITGIATIGDKGIILGKPNETYITFEVEKIGDTAKKGILTIDKTNTKAFLQGNSVLDENQEDLRIEI
jgi:hypothetical protein